jgi:hypothetical protein
MTVPRRALTPSTVPRRPLGAWLIAACLSMATLACDEARSGGASVVPHSDGVGTSLTPEGSFEGESIDELKIRLDRLVGQQDRLTAASSTDAGKCEELCELSRAICEVKTKMCELADAHVSDGEYQDLCRQAKQRCQRASDSCIRCVQTHERAYGSGFPRDSGSCAGEPAVTKPEPKQ